jgi:hypothetical protein
MAKKAKSKRPEKKKKKKKKRSLGNKENGRTGAVHMTARRINSVKNQKSLRRQDVICVHSRNTRHRGTGSLPSVRHWRGRGRSFLLATEIERHRDRGGYGVSPGLVRTFFTLASLFFDTNVLHIILNSIPWNWNCVSAVLLGGVWRCKRRFGELIGPRRSRSAAVPAPVFVFTWYALRRPKKKS